MAGDCPLVDQYGTHTINQVWLMQDQVFRAVTAGYVQGWGEVGVGGLPLIPDQYEM